jgi:ABC-type nitrate/sulfonate/bicarbonate transport system substrate-binding protein
MNPLARSAIGVLLAIVLGQAARAEEPLTLRYGQNAASVRDISTLPQAVAIRKGFFAREGVDLTVVPTGAFDLVSALDKGDIDMSRIATPYLVEAALKGSDLVAIAGQTANPLYSLIARPDIASFAELKGKLIGLSIPVDTITLVMRKLLALKGLREPDYRVKAVVGTLARFDCLKSGECTAVPMRPPDDAEAVRQGFRRLGVSTETGELVFNVDMVRRAWGQAHKELLTRYVRAMAASFRFINDPANRDATVDIIVALTGTPADVARQVLAPYLEPDKHVLPRQGEISLKGFAEVLALMGEGGVIATPVPAAERFVDLQYLKAAGLE